MAFALSLALTLSFVSRMNQVSRSKRLCSVKKCRSMVPTFFKCELETLLWSQMWKLDKSRSGECTAVHCKIFARFFFLMYPLSSSLKLRGEHGIIIECTHILYLCAAKDSAYLEKAKLSTLRKNCGTLNFNF